MMSSISIVENRNCMGAMLEFPDKYFDLAIVDPPYGIGETWRKDKKSKFYTHRSTYKNALIPDAQYFRALFRVSKEQIVWGGNYYTKFLPPSKSWIVWDKCRSIKTHMAECELAWTSFKNTNSRIYEIPWNGFIVSEARGGGHPHEKPIKLYRNTLNDFAKSGDKILDTHLGSGSSRIAAHDLGFDFWGYELDPTYFEASVQRFAQFTSQTKLFTQ